MKLKSLLTKLDSNIWTDVLFLHNGKVVKNYIGYSQQVMKNAIPQKALEFHVRQIRRTKAGLQIINYCKDINVFEP